jgi:hypothetical protein
LGLSIVLFRTRGSARHITRDFKLCIELTGSMSEWPAIRKLWLSLRHFDYENKTALLKPRNLATADQPFNKAEVSLFAAFAINRSSPRGGIASTLFSCAAHFEHNRDLEAATEPRCLLRARKKRGPRGPARVSKRTTSISAQNEPRLPRHFRCYGDLICWASIHYGYER